MRLRTFFLTLTIALGVSGHAYADPYRTYEVSITNLTRGQTFTPQLLVTHRRSIALFELGSPASLPLEILAEAGDTAPLTETLLSQPHKVGEVTQIDGLLGPGETAIMRISASRHHRYLSLAAMLIPTNDTFVALDRLVLPKWGSRSTLALAYDAGTEANDQNCVNIPGPRCGGAAHSPGPNPGDEGYVYVSNGFHNLPVNDAGGEVLGPAVYDWRNPVAKVVVKRVH